MGSSPLRTFFFGREWRGRPYLISPFFDVAMAGGLALIVFAALVIFSPPASPHFASRKLYVAVASFWLAFVVNDPHFTVSYQLLYRNYGEKLQRFKPHRELWWRAMVAGIVAPAVMTIYFTYALITHRTDLFADAINAMLVIVGWHYAKQAYGVFVVLSALKGVRYAPWRRRLFLINSYVVWAIYCLLTVSDSHSYGSGDFFGVPYQRPHWFDLNPDIANWVGGVFVFFAMASLIAAVWDKRSPRYSKTGLIGYFSVYYLLLISFLNPLLILLYPFFHSLQYLLFVYAYKRGEAQAKQLARRELWRFVLAAFISGIVFFAALPQLLEAWMNPAGEMLYPFSAAIIVFINIHHYFIDNVVWRRENTEISSYLFHGTTKR